MTKEEYITDLVSQNLTGKEIVDLASRFQEEEEVKTNDVATQDADVTSTTGTASESSDGISDYISVAKPSETYSPGDGYEYKYEVDEKGMPTYYSKTTNSSEWLPSESGSKSELSVASKFKHADVNTDAFAETESAFEKANKALITAAEESGSGEDTAENIAEKKKLLNEVSQYYSSDIKEAKEKLNELKSTPPADDASEKEIKEYADKIQELENSTTPLGIARVELKKLQEKTAPTTDQLKIIDKKVLEFSPTKMRKGSWLDDDATIFTIDVETEVDNQNYSKLVNGVNGAKSQLSRDGIEPPSYNTKSPSVSEQKTFQEELKVYNQKIDEIVKKDYEAELIQAQKDDNVQDWADSEDNNWSQAWNFIKENPSTYLFKSAQGFKEVFIDESDSQEKKESFKRLLELNVAPKLEKTIKIAATSPKIIEDLIAQQNALATGTYQTQEEIDEANKLMVGLNNKAKDVYKIYEQSTLEARENLIPDLKTIEDLKMLDYNFNVVPIFATNALNATIEGVQSIGELGYRIADMPNAVVEQVERWTGKKVPPNISAAQKTMALMLTAPFTGGAGIIQSIYPESVKEGKDKLWGVFDEYQDQLMSGLPPAKTLGELEDMGDWGRYTATMVGSQLPNTVVMFGTGSLALPLLTAQAGGGAFLEMESDMKNSREANAAWLGSEPEDKNGEAYRQWKENEPVILDYTPAQMYGVAMGKMALEYATEKVSLGLIKEAKTIFNANKIASKGFIENVAGLLTPNALKAGFYGSLGVLGEGIGEGIVELGGNFLDREILGKEVDLLEGVPDAMFSGVFMAGVVYKAPGYGRQIFDIVKSADTAGVLANNQLKIEKLQEDLKNNPNMSVDNKERIKLRIAKLVKKSTDFVNKDLDRYSTMTVSDIRELSKIELEKFKLQNELESVKKDTGIVSGKQDLIAGIQQQITAANVAKAELLAPQIALEKKNPNRPTLSKRTDMVLAPESMQNKDVGTETNEQSELEIKKQKVKDRNQKSIDSVDPSVKTPFNKVGDKWNSGFTSQENLYETDPSYNPDTDGDGYEVITKVIDPGAKTDGKLSKAPKYKITVFKDKASADAAIAKKLLEIKDKAAKKEATLETGGETKLDQKAAKGKEILDSYSRIDKLAENDSFNPEKIKRLTENQKNKILENAGGSINSTLNRLWKPGSLLTKAEFKKALEGEYLKAYLEYKLSKDKGQGVGRQVSNLFNLRANKIATENIKKGKTVSADSEKAQQIADKTEQKEFDEKESQEDTQREKVYSSQTDQVDSLDTAETKALIKDEVSKDILLAAAKGKNAADTARDIANESKLEYFKRLRKDIGTFTSQKYKDFVNSLDKSFIKSLPVADIKRRFGKLFGIKKTGTTPTKQTSKSGKPSYFNKPVYNVPKVTAEGLQKFKDYFLGGEKRQQSLYNLLATDFALESIQELMADDAFMSKLETALGDSGITAIEFMQSIENQLDKRIKEDTSLDVVDKRTVDELIDDTITEENVEDITPDILTKAITKLDRFTKPDGTLKMDFGITALAGLVNTGLKTLKLALKSGVNFISALSQFKNYLKQRFKELNKQNSIVKTKKYLNIANEKDSRDKTTGVVIKTIQVQKGTRTDKDGNIIKQGTDKNYGVFDEGALLQEDVAIDKTETQGQGRNRIANNFISKFPQYRDMIKRATSGGITLSMFQTSQEFDNQISKPKSRQEVSKRNPYNSENRLTKAFIDLVTNNKSKFKADQLQNLKAYIDYWKNVAKYLQANPNDAWFFGRAIADAAAGGQGGFLRYSALVGFYATDRKGFADFLSKVVEEHGYPQADLNESMLAAAIDNNMEDMSKIAEQAFLQGSLLDTDDTLVNKLYSTNQTQGFYDITSRLIIEGKLDWLPPGLAAWGRFAASGINPNLYKSTFNGKSIADIFGVGVGFDLNNSKNTIAAQNKAIIAILTGTSQSKAIADFKADMKSVVAKEAAALLIQETANTILEKQCNSPCKVPMTTKELKTTLNNSLDTKVNAQKVNKPTKGISVFDFDDTLAKTNSKVIVTMPDGKTSKIDATEFAKNSVKLEQDGAQFNFDEFSKVIDGKKGPLADLALKRQGKFGSGDIFVLTARPQAAAQGIKTFLDGIGLNLPIENITGLENGSPQAKAQWILSKTAEGYNDFYFADDAIKNVKAVKQILDQVDIKSRVQQAIVNKKERLNKEFNQQLEEVTGKEAFKTYSKSRASIEGGKKDKGLLNWLGNQFTITPSAEDFMGLMYDLIGVGKEGNRHKSWIKENLIDPLNKAEQEILSAKVSVAKDFAALKDKFPSLKTSKLGSNPLLKSIGVGPYTKSQAMRVYMWVKQGMDIPGLSKRDQNALVAAVEADSELRAFADQVILIQKDSTYPAPGQNWVAGNISSDIIQSLDKGFRNKLLTEFNENLNAIFTADNLNKLEALYGTKWVEALQDSIRRMKAGSNRPVYQGGGSRVVNELLDWLNGSVGAIMFLNMRSGLLQLTSAVNFINWGDNNMYAAAKAFANQKQWWSDVLRLMNSDYLVNRRDGLKINVNEAELVDAGKKDGMKGALAYFLDKGFLITRIMDSLAIGTGGAAFFRNRINALLKRINPDTNKLYTKAEAEARAFDDFYAIAEESQQSSNPSKISQQQASLAGRVILSFQNTTMQYMRMNKKSIRDLYNRRKNPGQTQRESDLGNISKIVYYTTVQNIIFHSLQNALFATLFEGGDEEEEDENKTASIANGMVDSLLFGLGFGGAAISTVKNVLLELASQNEKKNPKYEEAVWSVFDFSPVLDSKVRKLKSAFKSFSWNRDEMKKRGWSLDNPAYLAIAQIIASGTNAPLDRVLRKIMNLRAALDEETRTWQKVALTLGWDTWSLGLPYWGLQSTIRKEEAEAEKVKADFKTDVRKLKASGYKKTMTPEKYEDVVEMKSPYGTVMYYYKIKKEQ